MKTLLKHILFVLVSCVHVVPALTVSNGTTTESSGIEVVYESPNSKCHADGRAYQCLPPFTNVAENARPTVTSQCGVAGEERICPHSSQCVLCDSNDAKNNFPPSNLIDKHQTGKETCWRAASQSMHSHKPVNITLSLGKRFEVYYVSLQPCGDMPHSIAISKSSDFGATWSMWQYFSQDCENTFGMSTSSEQNVLNTTFGEGSFHRVFCQALKPVPIRDGGRALYHEATIAFSTTFGRPSMQPWSPLLIDWMTITDIRITLLPYPARSRLMTSQNRSQSSSARIFVDKSDPLAQHDEAVPRESRLFYGFSDIAIGGRCKCNGHASRCIRDRGGRLRCDCQHNTAGDDCERCADSYLDQPWGRGTILTVNECKKCDCNLHTEKCHFNRELHIMSGQTSGGVCEDCQHNTAGRKCHFCVDGYYRDWTLPLAHDHVCVQCRCHPIGAINSRLCDKKTGQCECKDGVTGQFCDRCLDGYKQTRSPKQPCAPDFGMNRLAHVPEKNCKPCQSMKKRFKFKKFCRKHLVIQASVISSQSFGEHVRYEMQVHFVWRRMSAAWYILPVHGGGQTVQPVWMRMEDVVCHCPDLQAGATYLLVTDVKSYYNRGFNELLLSHKSLALPWQDAWQRRLLKFKKQEMRGECQKFVERTPRIGGESAGGDDDSGPEDNPLKSADPGSEDLPNGGDNRTASSGVFGGSKKRKRSHRNEQSRRLV